MHDEQPVYEDVERMVIIVMRNCLVVDQQG
jgi:hypothetical protein